MHIWCVYLRTGSIAAREAAAREAQTQLELKIERAEKAAEVPVHLLLLMVCSLN